MSLDMGGMERWICGVVSVAVGSVDRSAVAIGDSLDGPGRGLNIEGTGRSDGYSAGMDSSFVAFGNSGFDQIAGPEPVNGLGTRQVAAWEPIFGDACSLIRPASGGFDTKDGHGPGFEFGYAADASGVQGMAFWDGKGNSVKLGPATGKGSDGQGSLTEFVDQTFAGRINDGRCGERFFGVS